MEAAYVEDDPSSKHEGEQRNGEAEHTEEENEDGPLVPSRREGDFLDASGDGAGGDRADEERKDHGAKAEDN